MAREKDDGTILRKLGRHLDPIAIGEAHGENGDIRPRASDQGEGVGTTLGLTDNLALSGHDGRTQLGARPHVIVKNGDPPAQTSAHAFAQWQGRCQTALTRNQVLVIKRAD